MEKENKPKEKEQPAGGDGGLGNPFDQTGGATTGGIATISVGPYVQQVPVAGRTVGEIRKRFKARMDIDDRSQAILDGEEVDAAKVVKEGQTLMFIHKAGEKGAMSEHEKIMGNPQVDVGTKVTLLKGLAMDEDEDAQETLKAICQRYTKYAQQNPEAVKESLKEKEALLNQILLGMNQGPFRVASFIEMLPGKQQARVIMSDGNTAYSTIADVNMKDLKAGDEVLLDKTATAILYHLGVRPDVGEEAVYERSVGSSQIEVMARGGDRFVYYVAEGLREQMENEDVSPGDTLIVNEKQKIAYRRIPPADGFSHYKYLERTKVPNITVEKDIGNPPQCIYDVLEHVSLEMTQPDLSRQYGVRRSLMRLLAGVSGSGKSLAIQAMCNGIYQIASEVTGVPFDELPPRIFRLRMSDILSCLLGESDKNLARFFKEVEQMADTYHEFNGEKHKLPVIAIIEEADGLARRRGMDHDGIYDRILTTALQWLDAVRPELNDKLIVYLGTTNEPDTLDRAFLRRIGGTIDRFHRLNKDGFVDVLGKHLKKVPMADKHEQAVEQVTEFVFTDERAIELKLKSGQVTHRYRKDMLTGALVDRAVQDAAKGARSEQAKSKKKDGGVRIAGLVKGFDDQFTSLLEQLNESNVGDYVDLPEGASVAALRRTAAKSVAAPKPIEA